MSTGQITPEQMMAEIHRLRNVVANYESAPAPQSPADAARPRPCLPDIALFSGKRSDYLVWSLTARQKLSLDAAALGGPRQSFAYLFSRMDANAQNLVAARFQQGLVNPDPEDFFQYLDSVFLDPNAADRAMTRLQVLRQKDSESFALFLPRFERLLHEAGLQDSRASISLLSQALAPALRRALVTIDTPTEYSDYTTTLFRVSSKLEEAEFFDRRGRTVQAKPTQHQSVYSVSDTMDWESTPAIRHRTAALQTPRLTHGPQPPLTDVLRQQLVASRSCFRCRRRGHSSRECTSVFVPGTTTEYSNKQAIQARRARAAPEATAPRPMSPSDEELNGDLTPLSEEGKE